MSSTVLRLGRLRAAVLNDRVSSLPSDGACAPSGPRQPLSQEVLEHKGEILLGPGVPLLPSVPHEGVEGVRPFVTQCLGP